MQYFEDLDQAELGGCELTIGSFDGIHLGHQEIIRQMIEAARMLGLPSVVLTFYPHPSVVLRGRRPSFYITSPEEKAAMMAELGVDYVINQKFDRQLSLVSAEAFLERLRGRLRFHGLWIGEDFALGHQRQGNQHFLRQAANDGGFELHVLPPLLVGGEVVSSTRVREALRSGDVARVAQYLGRLFAIPGKVVEGAGRGRKLGIPTANLSTWDERAYPHTGVYACLAEVEGKRWMAVSNIGTRPTFDEVRELPVVEAHLLDFQGDLYGKDMTLRFVDRLREERRFPSKEALLDQIRRDIERARPLLQPLLERKNA
ncbi:MAG TPA: bifunctional riboflavin kinase/FAD synthetase [Anaerolineales bacterium]|nr:bifunctional riboflavin kinase/FAD synthetase [Anaerolineales bacterium]